MNKIEITVLSARVLDALSGRGLKAKTVHEFERYGTRRIVKHCLGKGQILYSKETVQNFVWQERAKQESGTLPHYQWGITRRAAVYLDQMAEYGKIQDEPIRPWEAEHNPLFQAISCNPSNSMKVIDIICRTRDAVMQLELSDKTKTNYIYTFFSDYLSYCKMQNFSRSWMDNTIAALRIFLLAVHSSNTQNIKSINAETINCFSTAMSNASEICMNVRRARCRQVGAYLHWLYDHKYTDLDYSLQLPNFKRTAPQIPQVWSPEEIDKILAVIDTANPVGRRNYAIFLLLARTGLRIGDVVELKFSNINWKENCISLSQQKTGNALSLPLSKELGMAIISYLQDGRPQSSSDFIFLSHNAPFQPLGEHNNFNPEFHKYLRRAGITIPTKRHTGVHTIRHSFATNMLRKGTPVQDVSQILGHSNISVTETYLRVDIEQMRLCSLSLEGLL